jgi:tRNA dimethylallyltransferase
MTNKNSKNTLDKSIIVITGPTASGKTSLSLGLAKEFGGAIICADSMTVYKGMNIGTDKPSAIKNSKLKIKNNTNFVIPNSSPIIPGPDRESIKKMDSCLLRNDNINSPGMTIHDIPHHMLDILNPDEEFNVAIFKKLAEKKIKKIQSKGNIPFLAGGSVLYIDSVVYGYKIPSAKPDSVLRKRFEEKDNDELFKQLVKLDPDAKNMVDKNNKRRIIRALEVCIQTGHPFTKQREKNKIPENILYLAIDINREKLYQKINKRVDEMMKAGFLDEVKNLYKKYNLSTAMQTTGYKQLIQYIDGKISLEEAVEKTKQSHRNYAKRQLTWLRRNKDVIWIKDKKEAEEKIKDFLDQDQN